MSARLKSPRFALCLAVVAALGLVWQAVFAQKEEKSADSPAKTKMVSTAKLGGVDRYLTHLSTDKPMYRPGEKLYARGAILHHATRRPLADGTNVSALIEIIGPKGDTVASGYVNSQHSSLGYSWAIPEGQPGGEYTIKATYPWFGNAPAERKFDIRAYRAPRLKSQIKFLRDGYGPGDKVVATLHTERAEGGAPAGAKVTVIARVDGNEAYRGKTEVDANGDCTTRFPLPAEISRGEGTLAMVIEDGGVVETASKTIPILLQTVDLTMYPEGGDLVADLPNQVVHFEAFTPAKKPADLAGVVLDENGKRVGRFRSDHEGRGRFVFTPKKGGKYALKITQPSGIATRFALPEVKDEGVVLSSHQNITGKGRPVRFSIGSTAGGTYTITLSRRETQVASQEIALKAGNRRTVKLDPGEADGVLIATVWDKDGNPRAERLVFRKPAHTMNVKITADAKRYVPGGKAILTVETTDHRGKPVSAVVGLTVTDDSVLEMIEKREQAPRLPVMVLLEDEVKELADAHVYLDPKNPKAPLAIDLILGTQGWRRFAFVDSAKFIEEHGDQARRALALRMVSRARLEEVEKATEAVMDDVDLFGAPGGEKRGGIPRPQAAEKADAAPGEPADAGAEEPAAAPEKPGDAPPDVADEPAPVPDPGKKPVAAGPPRRPAGEDEAQLADREDFDQALNAAAEKRKRRAIAGKDAKLQIRNDFVAVRFFAHQVRPDRKPGERIDFTETLFWHAGIKTNEKTGKASVEFGLNDSVTSFRVFADAFNADGALGTGTIQIESVEPFYLEPKMPLEVTATDKILLPIGIVNATDAAMTDTVVKVDAHGSLSIASPLPSLTVAADERLRRLLEIAVGQHNGPAELTLSAQAGPYGDKVTRTVVVKPQGFPIEAGFGGMAAASGTVSHEIEIPEHLVPKSLTTRSVVFPTPLANMTEALERLIREPYGCFEQTSSTTYPLVMAQQYFMSHTGVDPSLVERSAKILDKGYNRLIGFECKSGGFEWFGGDPGHEALTAYGLLEFTDMAQVYAVDQAMLDRTHGWLLNTRDGKGGFTRKRRALHTWITDPECSNGYIMWALLSAGEKPDTLKAEVAWVRDAGEKAQNTYAVALAANVLALAGDEEGSNHLLDKLAGKQTEDGSLTGATTSIVGSGGQALVIETTSLAVLAWLQNPRYASNVEKSIVYLAESCKAGRFGSTQSTVLALRAIIAYDQSRAKPKAPGALQLVIDGNEVGEPVKFDKDTEGAIELPDVAELLTPGKHKIELKMTGGSDMPYSIAVNYNTIKPATAKECKVRLETELRDVKIEEGAVTEANVVAVNRTGEPIPTPVAIIGIPGGLEVRHDQLKELVKSGKIDAYEVIGREVVLYWRSLKAEERVELPVSLVAAVPGTYTGPASRAYLYYTAEFKHWNDGLAVEITPK